MEIGETDELRSLIQCMLRQNYSEYVYRCSTDEVETINKRVSELINKNNFIQEVKNHDGALCAHYPPTLFIPWHRDENSSVSELCSLISQAKTARARTRFVIPAFAFGGKNVCRSSTLSGILEVYGRQVASVAGFGFDTSLDFSTTEAVEPKENPDSDRSTFSRLRDSDCDLLKRFNVHYICDFMVEYKKMKYWLPLTSSEKADPHNRYHDFEIIPMPYPGSEFFRIWRDSGYTMRGLLFDWGHPSVEVPLRADVLRKTRLSEDIDWSQYKVWDVTTLTTNYLKLLLGLLFEGSGGMLLHCVSGWDRTPLFISLMRCLLWADDLIHQSLSPFEMLYVTLAYDWYFFGHKLRTRMEVGEEILRFAFSYLAEIASDTSLSIGATYHTVIPIKYPDATVNVIENGSQEFVEVNWSAHLSDVRQNKLRTLTQLFFSMWDTEVEASGIARAFMPSVVQPESKNPASEEQISQSERPSSSPSSSQFHHPVSAMVSQLSSAVTSAAVAVVSGLTKPLTSSLSTSKSEDAETD